MNWVKTFLLSASVRTQSLLEYLLEYLLVFPFVCNGVPQLMLLKFIQWSCSGVSRGRAAKGDEGTGGEDFTRDGR